MAVTAQKIAELAGVSRGTVDRALHNRGRVNPEVAARIQKIAAELGYKPNLVGQALVRSRQGAKLGVILQSTETPTMQIVQAGVRRAADELRASGGEVLLRELRGLDDELLLEFQSDDLGVLGDVRDIVIKRPSLGREVGLSIKHNHEAIKHSRLSYGLDFAKEWFGNPCSWEYWQEVKPLFDRLKDEKKRGSKWSELPDKESGVYIPLLKAFMAEIKRAAQADAAMPQKMVEYLIGTKDYYKIISYDKNQTTVIRTFNIHNTLAVQADQAIPTVQLPTKIVDLKFRSWGNNTVEMHLNNGWSLSFRIHNASAKVEPSLKFDIQFLKMPASILSFTHRWK